MKDENKKWIDTLNFSKLNGLIPVIVQHRDTLKILMVGFMNRESVEKTFETKNLHFFSRTRQKLWQKGETSGNFLLTQSLQTDCDNDAVIAKVTPKGPVCHTGNPSCFFKEKIILD
ncbi:MAG: phosphoribosyl-AMP cyclohydrolase [Candidatus Ranarchaeia archaeon]